MARETGFGQQLKCFEYMCLRFPQCARAVDCCGVDDFFEGRTLAQKDCCAHLGKSYFQPKEDAGWGRPARKRGV